MSHFIYDNTNLPDTKSDLVALPLAADPDKYVVADDWNTVSAAIVDIRSFVKEAKWYGLFSQAADPAPTLTQYLYYKNDGTLHLKDGSGDRILVQGDRTVSAGIGLSGGGPLSSNISLALSASGVSAGTYTRATVTVDQYGRITTASTNDVNTLQEVYNVGIAGPQTITLDGTRLGIKISNVQNTDNSFAALILSNPTLATVGAPSKYSPILKLSGNLWDTISSSTKEVSYIVQSIPGTLASFRAGLNFSLDIPTVTRSEGFMLGVSTLSTSLEPILGLNSGLCWYNNATPYLGTLYAKVTALDDAGETVFVFSRETDPQAGGVLAGIVSNFIEISDDLNGLATYDMKLGATAEFYKEASVNRFEQAALSIGVKNGGGTVTHGVNPPSGVGSLLALDNRIIKFNSGTHNGTIAQLIIRDFTVEFVSAGGIVDKAAAIFIPNAPNAGTNCTITNSYSIYAPVGKTYFGGNGEFGTNLDVVGELTAGNIVADSSVEATDFYCNLKYRLWDGAAFQTVMTKSGTKLLLSSFAAAAAIRFEGSTGSLTTIECLDVSATGAVTGASATATNIQASSTYKLHDSGAVYRTVLSRSTNNLVVSSLANAATIEFRDLGGSLAGILADSITVDNGVTTGPLLAQTGGGGTNPISLVGIKQTTAATVGSPTQYSPKLYFTGSAWDTDGAVAKEIIFNLYAIANTGNDPGGDFILESKIGGGAANIIWRVGYDGGLTVQSQAYAHNSASDPRWDFDINFERTKTWPTGALTNDHCVSIKPSTIAFVGASTLTNAASLYIKRAPQAGANCTITNAYAIWVDDGITRLDGDLDHNGSNIGFFGATGGVQQTSGADLTNNVVAGTSVNNQVDSWNDLANYANDSNAIRNAIHQLARKLKQVNDGLRVYGLLT